MNNPVNVIFVGENFPDGGNKRMQVVQQMIQMLADGSEEHGIQGTPEMCDYKIMILNAKHMVISKGYDEDRDKVMIGIDFSVASDEEFYKNVTHILHVYIHDLKTQDFGAFMNDEYSWLLKNSLNTYQTILDICRKDP